MNSRRQQRLIAISAILAVVVIAIALMVYSLRSNIDLFYTPSEIVLGKDGQIPSIGQRVRVGGLVVPGSVARDEQSLAVQFSLVDTGPQITVAYDSILPDLFREGQGIVATGILTKANHVVAEQVLAKHDENYMPPEIKQAMEKGGHVAKSSTAGSD